jgi:hypothetical protein
MATIQALLDIPLNHDEDLRMITVRLPDSLHAVLHEEARQLRTSMNKLAVAKLRMTLESFEKLAEMHNLEQLAPLAPLRPAPRREYVSQSIQDAGEL